MIESDASTPPLDSRQSSPSEGRRAVAAPPGGRGRTAESLWASFRRRFPTTSLTLTRLPVPLVIFGFAMFILVRALDSLGWIAVFATWAARVCTSPAKTVFFLGPLISWFLCSLFGTNIGSAIVMVEILRHPNFAQSAAVVANPNILRAAIYSTAISSNIGACSFTFSARCEAEPPGASLTFAQLGRPPLGVNPAAKGHQRAHATLRCLERGPRRASADRVRS